MFNLQLPDGFGAGCFGLVLVGVFSFSATLGFGIVYLFVG